MRIAQAICKVRPDFWSNQGYGIIVYDADSMSAKEACRQAWGAKTEAHEIAREDFDHRKPEDKILVFNLLAAK